MNRTKYLSYGIGVALALGALSAGCAQESSNSEPENIGDLQAELVGTVEMSPTHTLKFWDYGNGMTRIEENYHMDRDRDAALTLQKVDVRGRSLSDVYAIFAGAQANPLVAAKLEQLDARALEVSRQNAGNAPEISIVEEAPSESGPVAFTAEAPARVASTDANVGVRQSAVVACEEPPYDWPGDVGWFKTNFCGNNASFCPTEVGWAEAAWSKYLSAYHSAGFNQSFCTTASYRVKYRSTASGSGAIVEASLINMTLPTRWVNDNSWTTPSGGRIRYWSRIQSTLDNRVSLAIHRTE